MSFRVADIAHARNDEALSYHVYVVGQRRGLTASRCRDTGAWSAQIVGVSLVEGLRSADSLENWLAANIDPDLLQSLRPVEQEV